MKTSKKLKSSELDNIESLFIIKKGYYNKVNNAILDNNKELIKKYMDKEIIRQIPIP